VRVGLDRGHRIERDLPDVALHEQLGAGLGDPRDRGDQRRVDHAAQPVLALEPRIRKVHEHARGFDVAEDLVHVQLRLAEHAVHGQAGRARAAIDDRDQVLANLESDVLMLRRTRGALEQELRIGASDLDLERTPGDQRRPDPSKPLEVQPERVDVLPDPHRYTNRASRAR
jgi:hypothetical protein